MEDSSQNQGPLKTEIHSMLMESSAASTAIPKHQLKLISNQQQNGLMGKVPDALAQRLNKIDESLVTLRRRKESATTLENGRAPAVNLYHQVLMSQTQSTQGSHVGAAGGGHGGGGATTAYSSTSCYNTGMHRIPLAVPSSTAVGAANHNLPSKLISRKRSQQPEFGANACEPGSRKAKSSLDLCSGGRVGSQMSIRTSGLNG